MKSFLLVLLIMIAMVGLLIGCAPSYSGSISKDLVPVEVQPIPTPVPIVVVPPIPPQVPVDECIIIVHKKKHPRTLCLTCVRDIHNNRVCKHKHGHH